MSEDTLTLGVLGLGNYFQHAYLPSLTDSASPFRVAAICRRNLPAMERLAGQLGNPTLYTSWQNLLVHPGLEAVLVSTPHHLHYEQVGTALEQRLHVLVDKPLCLDAAQADELVRLARRHDRVLSVAYNYHYGGHFQAARQWIASGRLGRITSVAIVGAARGEGSPILDPDSWYHEPTRSGGGSMVSGGTHRLEAILWLTGLRPRSVFARMRGPTPLLDVQAGLVLELEDGVVATLLNEAQAPAGQVEISIYGERGAIFIRNQNLQVVGPDGENMALEMLPETDALSDFYVAVAEGKPLLTTAEDGYWAVAGVQAAYESARSGRPQPVRQPSSDGDKVG